MIFTDALCILVSAAGERSQKLGEQPLLVIAETFAEKDILLMFCNHDWEVQGVMGCDDVETAKKRAEDGYQGSKKCWIEVNTSEAELADYLRSEYQVDPESEWWLTRCSFCSKTDEEVPGFMTKGNLCICFLCIEFFYHEIQQKAEN